MAVGAYPRVGLLKCMHSCLCCGIAPLLEDGDVAMRNIAGMERARASTSGILMAWHGTSGCTRSTCWAQGCQASPPVAGCVCLLLKLAVAAKGG